MINIKSDIEINKMKEAAKVVRDLLFDIEPMISEGVTTLELDKYAESYIIDKGAIPGFKGLYGFPGTLCVSINDEVVHGIPGNRKLVEGDIIGIDVGAICDGYYGDHAKTFPVGMISEDVQKLINVTRECLMKGIEQATPGNRIGDIGYAIQNYAESNNYSVVKELVGHGIGQKLHEEPQIPNYGLKSSGALIAEGMCFAIEPMINFGEESIYTKSDNWTVCTKDGQPSAHFEHTIAVTKDGPEILTR